MRNKYCRIVACLAGVALAPVLAPAQTTNFWTNTANAAWTGAANWSNAVPAEGGLSNNVVAFWRAGTYTATDDFTAFQLNQLSFSNATVTLAGSALSFVSNGATLPQVVQAGATAAIISAPLVLSNQTTFAGAGAGRITITPAASR